MKDYIGYKLKLTAEVKYSETAIHGGRSSARLVQPNAQQDTSAAPLTGPLQCAAADALQVDQHKYPGDGLTGLATLWFSQRRKERGASLKPQAASFKLQAASIKLQDLRAAEKFHGARTKVLNADKSIVRMLHVEGNLMR